MGKTLILTLAVIMVVSACDNQSAVPVVETVEEAKSEVVSLVSKAPEGAKVFILSPQDGAVVPSTFDVTFGLAGMGVAPAGIDMENTGHHHILIDVDELPDMSMPLPTTENIVHFGGGQTQTTLTLSPGTHTLQLLLGNHLHVPHDQPVLSEKITITVE